MDKKSSKPSLGSQWDCWGHLQERGYLQGRFTVGKSCCRMRENLCSVSRVSCGTPDNCPTPCLLCHQQSLPTYFSPSMDFASLAHRLVCESRNFPVRVWAIWPHPGTLHAEETARGHSKHSLCGEGSHRNRKIHARKAPVNFGVRSAHASN